MSLISFACHLRIRVYAIHRLYIMRCIYYIYSISSLCVSREIGIHANSFFAFTFGLCLLVLFYVHAISRPQK